MLDERKAAILRAVVEEYIETAQPVGSGHVADCARGPGLVGHRAQRDGRPRAGGLPPPAPHQRRPHPHRQGLPLLRRQPGGPGPLAASESQQVRHFFAKAHGELEQMLHDTTRSLRPHRLRRRGGRAAARGGDVRSVQLVGLGPRTALLVAVLSNGAVEKRTVDLSEDTGDERLAAATAHLSRARWSACRSRLPARRCRPRATRRRRHRRRRARRVASDQGTRRRQRLRRRRGPHGRRLRRGRHRAPGARHPRAAVRRRHAAPRRPRPRPAPSPSAPRPGWSRWPSARSSSPPTRSRATPPAPSACSARPA